MTLRTIGKGFLVALGTLTVITLTAVMIPIAFLGGLAIGFKIFG